MEGFDVMLTANKILAITRAAVDAQRKHIQLANLMTRLELKVIAANAFVGRQKVSNTEVRALLRLGLSVRDRDLTADTMMSLGFYWRGGCWCLLPSVDHKQGVTLDLLTAHESASAKRAILEILMAAEVAQ